MIKIIRKIVFKSVLVIILLHTLVSHPYSDDMLEIRHLTLHQNSKSIIGFLKLVFHEREDKNLDNLIIVRYQITRRVAKNYQSNIIANKSVSPKKNKTARKPVKYSENFNSFFIAKPNGVRGSPPQVTQYC